MIKNAVDIRKNLEDLRGELSARVERTHKHIHEREERISGDYGEQSVEMENQELVIMLDAEGRDELRQIEKALHRLDEDNYDQCSKCGELIADARLEALLFTETCIVCASEER
jgi:DnaK suppressor protein